LAFGRNYAGTASGPEGAAEALRKKLKTVLLDLHETHPEAFNAVKAGWSEAKGAVRYRPVDDSYYDSFRNLMGNQAALVSILNRFAR
jgi:hypothetical protein